MKLSIKLILVFVFIMIIGFIPWESLLSIQIRNDILISLTSFSMGLAGLLGLICTVLINIIHNKKRFSKIAMLLLPCLLIPIALVLIVNLLLPTFKWQDTDVYRNGNDYLVVQEFEGFVTSNLRNPRIVRTTSPYGIIRIVEEQQELKNDDRFRANEVFYNNKTWHKEPPTK